MKVKLLKDFQGRETRNLFIRKDHVADVEEDMAVLLVRNGWAEMILDPEDFAELAVEAGDAGEIEEAAKPVEMPKNEPKPKGKKRGGR